MTCQHTCGVAPLPVLDRAAMHGQLGPPGAALVDELLGLWLGDLDDRLEMITSAARNGQARALAIAAHTLRGSATYVAASRLASSCAEIERLIDSLAAWPAIDAAIGTLYGHAGEARAALTEYRSGSLARADDIALRGDGYVPA